MAQPKPLLRFKHRKEAKRVEKEWDPRLCASRGGYRSFWGVERAESFSF